MQALKGGPELAWITIVGTEVATPCFHQNTNLCGVSSAVGLVGVSRARKRLGVFPRGYTYLPEKN